MTRPGCGLCRPAVPADHQRDQESGRLDCVQAGQCRGAGILVAGRLRRSGAEVFPQGRRARAPEEGRREHRALLPVALGRRRGGARRRCRRRSAISASTPPSRCSTVWPAPGPIGAGRAAISTAKTDARAFFDELRFMLADADVRAELAAMVQHRPALGLRHRRPEPGPLSTSILQTGELTKSKSAYEHPQPHACFIQGDQRRPGQRRRHHGPVGARGAPVQIRLRHRLELLARCAAKARSCPAAASRPA